MNTNFQTTNMNKAKQVKDQKKMTGVPKIKILSAYKLENQRISLEVPLLKFKR